MIAKQSNMKSYHIHLETFLSDDYLDILNSYWEIKDNEFVNKPKQLAEKNNITLAELNSLVKEYSHCKISFADCVDCKNEISTLVYSQTSFIEKRRKTNYKIKNISIFIIKRIRKRYNN